MDRLKDHYMKKNILLLIVLSIFWACEKPVTIDIPEKPSRLVVNGWIGKDSIISVHIGKSKYSLAPRDFSGHLIESYTVKNAVPVIYENNISIDTLIYNPSDFQYYSLRNRKIRAGYSYVIKVNAAGFTEAIAESNVPSLPAIRSLQRVKNARTNSSGLYEDEITLTLNDPAGEENFYLVQVYSPAYSIGFGYPIACVRTTDKDIEMLGYADPMDADNCYEGDNLLMKDVNFNGGQKVLKLYVESGMLQNYVDPGSGRVSRPYVHVISITKDHFKFTKSFNLYWNTEDNPFAEPVNVFTNVRNGYGVFSAYEKMVDTLR